MCDETSGAPPAKPVRVWRPMIISSSAILLASGLALLAAAIVRNSSVQEHSLTALVESQVQLPAPADIERQVREMYHDELEDDKRQSLWDDSEEVGLISLVPINLDDDRTTCYLAYPRILLPTFRGAHAISCWIFRERPDGTHELLLSGRCDVLGIRGRRTNGLRDVDLLYYSSSREVTQYRFDGKQYRTVGRLVDGERVKQ